MQRHLGNVVRWGWLPICGFSAVLVMDMRANIRNADVNIHDLLTNAGFDNAPEKLATYVWSNPLLVLAGIALLFILGGLISWAVESVWKKLLKGRQDALSTKIKLADECDRVARGILSLVSDHHSIIQSAWSADMEQSFAERSESGVIRPLSTGQGHGTAVARLNTIYGDRFAQDAWKAVYESSQFVVIRQSDVWPMDRTVVDYHLMPNMAALLTKVAAALRSGKKELSDARHQGDRPI